MESVKTTSGLMGINLINHNYHIGAWLLSLFRLGIINETCLEDGRVKFGLNRTDTVWHIFIIRLFTLLGVILFVTGLIFFMAWNWEDMSRLAKFALLQAVFILFAGYSLIRWPRDGADGWRWDARCALLGVGLSIGGLLALYGQIYQTGADPWELFRAWALLLILLALPGRAVPFWFMVWLTASLWLGLYLQTINWPETIFFFYLGLGEFVFLSVYEIIRHVRLRSLHTCQHRWLGRLIGVTAVILMTCCAIIGIVGGHSDGNANVVLPFSLLLIGLSFFIYYRLLPDPFMLFAVLASLGSIIASGLINWLSQSNRFDLEVILASGAIILFMVFAVLKSYLTLREKIRQKNITPPTAGNSTQKFPLLLSREQQKQALRHWLITYPAINKTEIDAFFTAEEQKNSHQDTWYVKVFVTLGVWLGASLSLGAFTMLYFGGLQSLIPLGIAGLIMCAISMQAGHGQGFAMKALSQIVGVFGLLYSALLFNDDMARTSGLLFLLFTAFWLLKPPFSARTGAFAGAAVCLLWFLNGSFFNVAQSISNTAYYAKTGCYCLGLLWAAYYLLGPKNGMLLRLNNPSGTWLSARFQWDEILPASAYACLGVFAVAAITSGIIQDLTDIFTLDFFTGTLTVVAITTGALAWHHPQSRIGILLLGGIAFTAGCFSPFLGLGLGLLFLAFQSGKNSFLGSASVYLGAGIFLYYYNLQASLPVKSAILMGTGAALLILAFIFSRAGTEEK